MNWPTFGAKYSRPLKKKSKEKKNLQYCKYIILQEYISNFICNIYILYKLQFQESIIILVGVHYALFYHSFYEIHMQTNIHEFAGDFFKFLTQFPKIEKKMF